MSPYKKCLLCPRRCGVNRYEGQRGFCGETSTLRLAFAGIHRGEEPPITGAGGSGTVFVSGCNLGCAFCQNHQISKSSPECAAMGRAVDTEEFAEICLTLKEHGAGNINIVTGSHAAPALALGAALAKKKGLSIPMLWNSSGYEGEETLNLIKDFVDMYLPDLKTLDPSFAAKFFHAPDYPEYAMSTILKMMEYGGYNAVMVRHLVIPGYLEITHQVLSWFSKNFCQGKNGALLSLMTQYTPLVREQGRNSIPNRYVSEDEYKAVLAMLDEFGIDDGFCQELVTGSDWLPDFKRQNPFSSTLSFPIWHWQSGFLQQPAFSS